MHPKEMIPEIVPKSRCYSHISANGAESIASPCFLRKSCDLSSIESPNSSLHTDLEPLLFDTHELLLCSRSPSAFSRLFHARSPLQRARSLFRSPLLRSVQSDVHTERERKRESSLPYLLPEPTLPKPTPSFRSPLARAPLPLPTPSREKEREGEFPCPTSSSREAQPVAPPSVSFDFAHSTAFPTCRIGS
ncbi:hypothetical protein KFK09_026322 [Dendrobium nobile]|uniref:Uncharacterized protein n=1 Tax=Dendrobium nobile TaxID=94219 RepID=A0A8T3A6G2_DENNO|nr:hypothetical protein KFK09_026322 [Dendrobium nobile]